MGNNLQDKIRESFISCVSKINETEDDEFKAEFNSPELIFPVVLDFLKETVLGFNKWVFKSEWVLTQLTPDGNIYVNGNGEKKTDSELFEMYIQYLEELNKK